MSKLEQFHKSPVFINHKPMNGILENINSHNSRFLKGKKIVQKQINTKEMYNKKYVLINYFTS